MADLSISVLVLQRNGTIVCVDSRKMLILKLCFLRLGGWQVQNLAVVFVCCLVFYPKLQVVMTRPYYKGNLFDSKPTISRARGVAEWWSVHLDQGLDPHQKNNTTLTYKQ